MKKINISNLLLVIIVLFQLIFAQALNLLDFRMSVPMALLVSQLTILIPFIIWCGIKRQNPLKEIRFKKAKPISIFFAVLIAFISYPVVIFLNMVSMLFVENAVSDIMPAVLDMGLLPGLFYMALLPAFVEETIFRGMLYNTYSKYRPMAGVVLSAILFGLMHMNFNQMPYAIYLGIIMAIMMEVCDSIIVPMVIHFTMNATSSIMAFLSKALVQSSGEAQTTDLKEAFMESFLTTMEQTGIELPQAELESMFPAFMAGSIIAFAVIAMIALVIVFVLIHAVAGINGRPLKEVLRRKDTDRKARLVDIWLILFMIYTLYQCVIRAIG